ncbi:uncharacterized protein LOC129592046 isoform X1 [Paramacrobiotus metropolitanus]|uniref:uncharacterized protein LOC129592046 isoform X1 n=1 Tax=Paramacrobiotus metropolitanus TaxID=2943436 RepID=UPI0024464B9F|nr:uncharacterized protein LOC129592046 isoform X1 [Paramacrobiotus metropolitanus]
MTQNGYTEDVLNDDLQRTGEKLDFDKLTEILKGATMPVRISYVITFVLVLIDSSGLTQVVYPEYIKRNFKAQEISTVRLKKHLRMVYDKRVLLEDFTTVPYGFKKPDPQPA